jgi:sugar phosphate isomerase/epimerase
MQIGLSSAYGIIRSELEKDYWGTIKKVAELGYKGIELGYFPEALNLASDYNQRFNSLGLKTVAYGPDKVDLLKNKFNEIVSTAKVLNCKYIAIYYGPCESKEQILRDSETYNEIGKRLHNEGLQFCYHNHCQEFTKFNGKYGLDILFENTDPRYLAAHIDVAWVKIGGEDPAKFILKYKGRCPLIHLKDFGRDIVTTDPRNIWNSPRKMWTEVGAGVVDFKSVLAASEKAGVEWGNVEQEENLSGLPPMESIKVSIQNLKKLGAK